MEVDGSASKFLLSNSLSGKVGISDAKDEDGCLEPGARMRPETSRYDSRKKHKGNFEQFDVQRLHFLWLWSCKIIYNESNNHISFQCSTRQTACDWHPTDGMRRPCGMVKSCHEFGR
jgi:hypothetical protein